MSIRIQRIDDSIPGMVQKGARQTSVDAANYITLTRGTLRARIMQILLDTGGQTDDELEVLLEVSYNSFGPRRRDLINAGLIRAGSGTRVSRRGRSQTIWVPTLRGMLKMYKEGEKKASTT